MVSAPHPKTPLPCLLGDEQKVARGAIQAGERVSGGEWVREGEGILTALPPPPAGNTYPSCPHPIDPF